MASLYRRGKIWWLKFKFRGKVVRRSLKTEKLFEARRKRAEIEYELTQRTYRPPTRTRLVPFLKEYVGFLRTIRTRKGYQNDLSYLRLFFGPVCEELDALDSRGKPVSRQAWAYTRRVMPVTAEYLEQILPQEIGGFIRERIAKEGIAPKTANRMREVLHRMYSYAVKEKGFRSPDGRAANPVSLVDRQRERAPQIRFLELDEIRQQMMVLEDSPPPLREMVATLIYAGLRRGELIWLTRSDIDLERRVIRVRAKTVGRESWQPKTGRNRAVPISSALRAYLAGCWPPGKCVWYFPFAGKRRWNVDNFSQTLRKINRRAGLDWTCLDFRHTFGSQLAMKGESLYKISELMGNSPGICRRHYAAVIPKRLHETVEFDTTPIQEAAFGPKLIRFSRAK